MTINVTTNNQLVIRINDQEIDSKQLLGNVAKIGYYTIDASGSAPIIFKEYGVTGEIPNVDPRQTAETLVDRLKTLETIVANPGKEYAIAFVKALILSAVLAATIIGFVNMSPLLAGVGFVALPIATVFQLSEMTPPIDLGAAGIFLVPFAPLIPLFEVCVRKGAVQREVDDLQKQLTRELDLQKKYFEKNRDLKIHEEALKHAPIKRAWEAYEKGRTIYLNNQSVIP